MKILTTIKYIKNNYKGYKIMSTNLPQVTVALEKVILSYPHLIEKEPIGKYVETEEKRKYNATFMLSKSDENHMRIVKEFKEKFAQLMIDAKLKTNAHELIKDGDEEWADIDDSTTEGKAKKEAKVYKRGYFFIKAANRFQPILTTFKNKEKFDMVKHKDLFYPGCYVHAIIELNPYKVDKKESKYKAIANRLHAVQFSKDGKRFGGVTLISGESTFDKFADEEDEDSIDDFDAAKMF